MAEITKPLFLAWATFSAATTQPQIIDPLPCLWVYWILLYGISFFLSANMQVFIPSEVKFILIWPQQSNCSFIMFIHLHIFFWLNENHLWRFAFLNIVFLLLCLQTATVKIYSWTINQSISTWDEKQNAAWLKASEFLACLLESVTGHWRYGLMSPPMSGSWSGH